MTLATIFISAICVLLVMGYQFNFSKHTIEQGGLVQLRSFPANAVVEMNGQQLNFTTPGKRNVSAGSHDFSMVLDGYRPWSKTVDVSPGQLLWLNYARLVPQSITTEGLKEFDKLADMLPAPDRESMVLLPDATKPQLTLVDSSQSDQVEFVSFQLPADSYRTNKNQKVSFAVQEWDFGSRFLIMEIKVDGKRQYLRVDSRDSANTVNISRLMGIDIDKINFSGTSGNQFYILSDGSLRKVDIGNKTVTAPLARDVSDFSIYGEDTIAYVARDEVGQVVGLLEDGKSTDVASINSKQPLMVDVTEYFSQIYVAVGQDRSVTIYRHPSTVSAEVNPIVKQMNSPRSLSWLQFSNQGRFLISGDNDYFVNYDMETRERYDGTLPKARVGNQPFLWLDDFYFVTIGGTELRIAEFDGANQQFITDAAPGYRATLSADGEQLYSVARQSDGDYVLQASRMVIQ